VTDTAFCGHSSAFRAKIARRPVVHVDAERRLRPPDRQCPVVEEEGRAVEGDPSAPGRRATAPTRPPIRPETAAQRGPDAVQKVRRPVHRRSVARGPPSRATCPGEDGRRQRVAREDAAHGRGGAPVQLQPGGEAVAEPKFAVDGDRGIGFEPAGQHDRRGVLRRSASRRGRPRRPPAARVPQPPGGAQRQGPRPGRESPPRRSRSACRSGSAVRESWPRRNALTRVFT
jgi:hypothetical protein